MKSYSDLKAYCDNEIKRYPNLLKKYKKEIMLAKFYYDAGIDLFNKLNSSKEKISKRYIIPFLLGFTDTVLDLEPSLIQVKEGASGGRDMPLYIGIYK